MKTFETPYVDVKKFDVEDILTTSGDVVEEEEIPAFMGDSCVGL